jgi:hypothetical protein
LLFCRCVYSCTSLFCGWSFSVFGLKWFWSVFTKDMYYHYTLGYSTLSSVSFIHWTDFISLTLLNVPIYCQLSSINKTICILVFIIPLLRYLPFTILYAIKQWIPKYPCIFRIWLVYLLFFSMINIKWSLFPL